MRKLMLSGTILLAAVANCTVAKAGYYTESNVRYERSWGAPNAASGNGYDYNWNVSNSTATPGAIPFSNFISFRAYVKNGRGDTDPILTEQTLWTGASQVKTFTWTRTSGTEVRPTTTRVTHEVRLRGRLAVTFTTPKDANTVPYAKAKVIFSAWPGDLPTPEVGKYVLVARDDGGPNPNYLNILNDGAPNESATPGQPTRSIPVGPASDLYSRAYKTLLNTPAVSTQSVEVQIRGYANADGRMIPPFTFLSADSSGQIESTQFYMN